MLNVSVLVSGGGSNLQAIIDAIENETIKEAKIVQVISSSKSAYALERAKIHKIKGIYIGKENYPDQGEREDMILTLLKEKETDLIVLAGYMSILGEKIISSYKNKIINIHPSLIPAYCGKGYYGKKVHQGVLDAAEKFTGATVHYVDEGVDTGEIILQKTVAVYDDDTVDSLAARVLEIEHEILPLVVKMISLRDPESEIL